MIVVQFVLTRFWSSVWGTYCPLRVNTQQLASKERVLIRGQQSAGGLFTLQCRSQFKGRSWQTFLNGLFVNFDLFYSLIPLWHSSRHPGRKQLLWNTRLASSAHHPSALSEKQQQRQKWFWTLFCLYRQRVWVILQSSKHLVFFRICAALQRKLRCVSTLLLSFPLSPRSLRCLHHEHIEFVTRPKFYFHFALGK